MSPAPFPRALALIVDDPNLAVDAALAAALPSMDAPANGEALRILGRRGHAPTLAAIVADFAAGDATGDAMGEATSRRELRDAILRHVDDLHAGLRAALESADAPVRLSAIALIVAADDARSAYLLAGALRSACPSTREAAAKALDSISARVLAEGSDRRDRSGSDANALTANAFATRRRAIVDALTQAVRGWEVHAQLPALEAALWFADELDAVLLEKLNQPRSRIGHALQGILETATDERLAGFVWRALAIPWLRPAAAKAIGHARSGAFLRSIARASSMLQNPTVSAGLHWVHDCAWARVDGRWPKGVHGEDAVRLVRLFAATGISIDRKMLVLSAWLRSGEESVRRAALEVLLADPSGASTRVLTELASRATGRTSDAARAEIRRRRNAVSNRDGAGRGMPSASPGESGGNAPAGAEAGPAAADDAFERFFEEFDSLTPGERRLRADLFRNDEDGSPGARVLSRLRAKLSSGVPLDRSLALRIMRELGATRELAERIYPLAYDVDPFVRSIAVALLGDLPGATAERVLRRAVDDADPRVQANAIETLDRLNAPDRTRWTEPKLDSRHNRVRANAVCSLLRLELRRAGEVLLDMMEDPSPDHRLSALWVIEHLSLRSAMNRVLQMSREDTDERIRKRAGRLMREFTAQPGRPYSRRHGAAGSPTIMEPSG